MNKPRHLEYPDCSIYEFLEENAKSYPTLCALNYYSREMTYRELLKEIDQAAKAFVAMGIEKGDAVTICLPNVPQAVISFYAINKIGAIANMIHPMSAEKEIIHYLSISKSKVIIALDMVWKKLEGVLGKTEVQHTILVSVKEYMPFSMKLVYTLAREKKVTVPDAIYNWRSFNELAKKVDKDVHVAGKSNECAVILYSGGTTGKPKGIMLSNLNFNALAMQGIDGCSDCLYEGARVLSVMPVFHGFGLGVCIHTVLNFGGMAIILPQFNAAEYDKLLIKYKPNVIAGVPAIYESLIRSTYIAGKDLSFLTCVISGGDSMAVNTKKKLNELLANQGSKTTVKEGYGLTECVTGTCSMPAGSKNLESIGLPYADMFYMIADPESGEELPYGEEGEIVMRGPTVMLGYLNEPEETANTLRVHKDGHTWLHTGDLGCMDEEGYVYFKQRLKRMIVSGGYNIYPQLLEDVICSHEQVVTCAVVGVPDEIMGQKVKAYVVLKKGVTEQEQVKEELTERLKQDIAKYALPREIVFMESLPKTLVGKIAYDELIKGEE
nr:acyl--CoA ligase [Eubacterium sp.]